MSRPWADITMTGTRRAVVRFGVGGREIHPPEHMRGTREEIEAQVQDRLHHWWGEPQATTRLFGPEPTPPPPAPVRFDARKAWRWWG